LFKGLFANLKTQKPSNGISAERIKTIALIFLVVFSLGSGFLSKYLEHKDPNATPMENTQVEDNEGLNVQAEGNGTQNQGIRVLVPRKVTPGTAPVSQVPAEVVSNDENTSTSVRHITPVQSDGYIYYPPIPTNSGNGESRMVNGGGYGMPQNTGYGNQGQQSVAAMPQQVQPQAQDAVKIVPEVKRDENDTGAIRFNLNQSASVNIAESNQGEVAKSQDKNQSEENIFARNVTRNDDD